MVKNKWLMDKNDLCYFSLLYYWWTGCHPYSNKRLSNFLAFNGLSLCILFVILAIKGVTVSYNSDLFFLSECLQTCILMIHTSIKYTVIHFGKNSTKKLLEMKAKFWKMDDFHGDAVFDECKKISDFCKRIISYNIKFVCFTAIYFYMQPFTAHELPAIMYVPKGWFIPLNLCLAYLCPFIIGSCSITDGFYYGLVTDLHIQFKLLGHKFKNLNFNSVGSNEGQRKIWNQLKELVQYHNFLLKYYEVLNSMFGPVFLVQVLISVSSASVTVFILTQDDVANVFIRVKCLFYVIILIVESGFYCFPSEYTGDAAAKIGDAVYESKWYENNALNVTKCLAVVMTKAQNEIIFHGYGMVWINTGTFILIAKTTFSFYTYLTNIKGA